MATSGTDFFSMGSQFDDPSKVDALSILSLGGSNILGALGDKMFPKIPNYGEALNPFQQSVGDPSATSNLQALLGQRAAGGGPSAAEFLMRGAQDRTASQAAGLARGAAGQGGVAAGSALRQAMNVGAQSNLQNTNAIGAIRANEQISAQQNLAQFLAQIRQQDIERQKAESDAISKAHELQYGAQKEKSGGILGAIGSAIGSLFG